MSHENSLLSNRKIQGTQQGHKMSHNVGTRLLSGFLVSFASGVMEWNCWMKQQSNIQKQRAFMAIQTDCLGALHRSRTGEVCWYSIENIIWNDIKSYDIYKKIK